MTRLLRCYRCNYDLAGLPPDHACPECGFEYTGSMFVLEGFRLRRAGWGRTVRLSVAFLVCALVGAGVFGWPPWFALLLAIAGIAPLVLARMLTRRPGREEHRPLVRYLITAEGVVGPTGRLRRWTRYSHPMLFQEGPDRWRLHIYPRWIDATFLIGVNAVITGSRADAESARDEIQRRIWRAQGVELPPERTGPD